MLNLEIVRICHIWKATTWANNFESQPITTINNVIEVRVHTTILLFTYIMNYDLRCFSQFTKGKLIQLGRNCDISSHYVKDKRPK